MPSLEHMAELRRGQLAFRLTREDPAYITNFSQ